MASSSGGRRTGVDGAEREVRTSGRRCGDEAPIRATASFQSAAHDAAAGFSGVAGGRSLFSSSPLRITSCADEADIERFRPCTGAPSNGGLTMFDVDAACEGVEYGCSDPDDPSRCGWARDERVVASTGGGGIGLA